MAGVSYQHWQWYDAPELSGLILGYILTLLLSAQRRGKGLPVLGNSSAVWITSLTPAGFQQTGKQPILCGPEILWQRWWKAQSCPEWEHDHTHVHIPCKPACGTGIHSLHSRAGGLGLLSCLRTPGFPHRLKTSPSWSPHLPWIMQESRSKWPQSQGIVHPHFWGHTPAWCWRKQGLTSLKPESTKSVDKAVAVVAKQNFIQCFPNQKYKIKDET